MKVNETARNYLERANNLLKNGGMSRLLRRAHRYVTAGNRSLPTFLIVGAKKSGTTSMFMYLRQHPQIKWAERKEIQYFSCNYEKGERWYRMQFPSTKRINKYEEALDLPVRLGEGGSNYLSHPLAPARIAKTVPNAKFIVLLRDPVERALSDYHHSLRYGEETRSLGEAFKGDPINADDVEHKVKRQGGCPKFFHSHSYLYKGLYARQLDRYKHYFDTDRLFVTKSEIFFNSTQEVMSQVFNFLGVSDWSVNVKAHNKGGNKKSPDEEIIDMLNKYYKNPNKLLSKKYNIEFE